MNPRTTRQARLANVGHEGNRILADATVRLRSRGEAAIYERCYLERAGVGRVLNAASSTDGDVEPGSKHEGGEPDLHPAAAALWDGTGAALATLRALLSLR